MSIEPVRKQITVAAPQATAFEVFTAGMGGWWNKEHSIGDEPLDTVVIEPRVGGRWFERGKTGTECEWGAVAAWEPPSRVVLTWQLDADWQYDPDLRTEVEVRFTDEGPETTRIDLEHRGLEALGDRAVALRGVFDGPTGWTGLLQLYTERVAA
ncbi:MAG TPA: SRPBCC family protein [Iamia sp.]|jgi:uncharacterized protein YndB with AHSA1/START domain|nr:SRPBCC family protein [Iamia sp.]